MSRVYGHETLQCIYVKEGCQDTQRPVASVTMVLMGLRIHEHISLLLVQAAKFVVHVF